MYVVDTANEVSNRLKVVHDPGKRDLDAGIVCVLMESLSNHNEYVRTFKIAKEMGEVMNLDSYAVRLYSNIPDRRYDSLAPGTLGCIVIGDDGNSIGYDIVVYSKSGSPAPGTLGCIVIGEDSNSVGYDIFVYSKSGCPQQVSKLHPKYMSLQYPLLFPFGEDCWSLRLKLRVILVPVLET